MIGCPQRITILIAKHQHMYTEANVEDKDKDSTYLLQYTIRTYVLLCSCSSSFAPSRGSIGQGNLSSSTYIMCRKDKKRRRLVRPGPKEVYEKDTYITKYHGIYIYVVLVVLVQKTPLHTILSDGKQCSVELRKDHKDF